MAVAPVTKAVRESIESNARSRVAKDDRFKLLDHEFLKRAYTQVSRATTDPGRLTITDDTPLWSSIAREVALSNYNFLPTPDGLSHTIQTHIQQAAKSVTAHWSKDLYKKSFKYTVLNALRLRLAPTRFQRYEQRRKAKPDANAGATNEATTEAEAEEIPRTLSVHQWTCLIKERFDEMACIVRKHKSDQSAEPRIQGVLTSLERLKTRPQGNDWPPKLIKDIAHRQQEAIAESAARDRVDEMAQPPQLAFETSSKQCMEDQLDNDEIDDDGGLYLDEEEVQDAAQAFDQQFEEQIDDDDTDESGDDDPDEGQAIESSGAQIHRLFTVVNILVHSPHINYHVNKSYVRKALLKNMKCTDLELTVARDLVNALLPFTPKRVPTDKGHQDPSPHVVLYAPMVLIAQAFLQAVGLHRFQRRLSPQVSVGSTSAIQLSSGVLYEILGSRSPNQFDITTPSGRLISNVLDAANPANQLGLFGAFFDMDRVQKICLEHNVMFTNR